MFVDPFPGPGGGGMGAFTLMFTIVPILMLAVFAYVIGSMIYRGVVTVSSPVLTRNAQAIAKRTHVWGRVGGTDGSRTRTSYYVTFELETLITQGPTFRSFHRGPN